MRTADAIELIGGERFQSLVFKALDYQVPPVFLCSEPIDGTSCLEPEFGDSLSRLEQVVRASDAVQRQALLADLHPVIQEIVEPGDDAKLAIHWLSSLCNDAESHGFASPQHFSTSHSRVLSRFPELRHGITPDGLFRLTDSLDFSVHGIIHQGFVIPFHSSLPVPRSEEPVFDLVPFLVDHARRFPDNSTSIAIDHRRMTPVAEHRTFGFKDHWRGRPYSGKGLDDPHAIGVTVHTAPDWSTRSFEAGVCLLEGIARTEYLWKHKDGIKTFEAEEVPRANPPRKPIRYFHAERSIRDQRFRHIDGAIMIYSPEDLDDRIASVRPRVPRARLKMKLFRIDGAITTDHWAFALSLYFRGNPLVPEYLSGHTGPTVVSV